MTDPFRSMEDVLGTDEREGEAVRVLGVWRDRLQSRILLVFALAGLVPALFGYQLVQDLQFRYNHGVAFMLINVVAGVALPWGIMLALGRLSARRVVLRRMDARIAHLAKAYEIPADRLSQIANLLRGL